MARLDVTEMFHGIPFSGHLHTQESLQHALNFQFRDSDTLIVTYPKSGTTWMQEVVTLVCNRGDPQRSQTVPNWARAPWLEQYYSSQVLGASQGPRLLTTHLPYHLLGPALRGSKAKIIYVSRNPKDVVVSFYHFHKMANFLPEPHSFQEFLDLFLEGKVNFGSWFDHVKGWTSQVGVMDNLLWISYEQMWLDLRGSIERVSSFLQRPLAAEEVNSCVRHCDFSSMKGNAMVNYTLIPQDIMDHRKGRFMRKGTIGDWKNTFTEQQSRHFDGVYGSKMKGHPRNFLWEGHAEGRVCSSEGACSVEDTPLKTTVRPV